jgi:hypothetical protein
MPPKDPPVRLQSHSNGAGQTISNPNPSNRTEAALRSTSGSKSRMRVMALRNSATVENDRTNPSAIDAGRMLPVCPTDAPSNMGSIGSVQGAATVTIPAAKARTRSSIERDPRTSETWSDTPAPSRISAGGREALLSSRHVFVRLWRQEHDPEKWKPVFRKERSQTKGSGRSFSQCRTTREGCPFRVEAGLFGGRRPSINYNRSPMHFALHAARLSTPATLNRSASCLRA